MGGATQLDMREVTSFLKVAATLPEESHNDAVTAVKLAMATWQRQTKGRTPVNFGHLANAFSYNVTKGRRVIKGELVNPLKYALPVEKGRRAGKQPPVEPLILWFTRKYGLSGDEAISAAWGLAKNLKKRSIPAVNMVADGLDASEDTIMKLFRDVGGDALKRLEKS